MKKLYEKLDRSCMKLDKLVVEFSKLEDEFEASNLNADFKKCIKTGQERLKSAQDWFIDCACNMEMELDEGERNGD